MLFLISTFLTSKFLLLYCTNLQISWPLPAWHAMSSWPFFYLCDELHGSVTYVPHLQGHADHLLMFPLCYWSVDLQGSLILTCLTCRVKLISCMWPPSTWATMYRNLGQPTRKFHNTELHNKYASCKRKRNFLSYYYFEVQSYSRDRKREEWVSSAFCL